MPEQIPDPGNPTCLHEFQVHSPVLVATTALAHVWKVTRLDGTFGALKVYHRPDMGSEAPGVTFLQQLDGVGTAQFYHSSVNTILIEWLSGPSLGDMVRQGRDNEAAAELANVASTIHSKTPRQCARVPLLEDRFQALFDLKFGQNCPAQAKADIIRARNLAGSLLGSQEDVRLLHGDLHHDNVRAGPRGYCAFDAKGVVGERCFELANAFRNPVGADVLVRDGKRIREVADIFSASFGVDRGRLLRWAAAKCALSIAWRCGPLVVQDPEFGLLALLLGEV